MKVKDILNHPSRWITKSHARRNDGTPCHYSVGDKFDLCGAIRFCYRDKAAKIETMLSEHVMMDLVTWNDWKDRTFEEVRELICKFNI